MSFQTGLSGLNASSRNLDVIGNNIANANTTGMKASRAEFADVVASSLGAGSNGGAGIGVSVATVSQQFSQGSINVTGNNLDVAINGGGFFQLEMPDGTSAYTRDGSFKLDKDGNIMTNSGAKVLGNQIDALGNILVGNAPTPLSLPTSAPIPANATTAIATRTRLLSHSCEDREPRPQPEPEINHHWQQDQPRAVGIRAEQAIDPGAQSQHPAVLVS